MYGNDVKCGSIHYVIHLIHYVIHLIQIEVIFDFLEKVDDTVKGGGIRVYENNFKSL